MQIPFLQLKNDKYKSQLSDCFEDGKWSAKKKIKLLVSAKSNIMKGTRETRVLCHASFKEGVATPHTQASIWPSAIACTYKAPHDSFPLTVVR